MACNKLVMAYKFPEKFTRYVTSNTDFRVEAVLWTNWTLVAKLFNF